MRHLQVPLSFGRRDPAYGAMPIDYRSTPI
jgi:hypothetical protein